MTKITKSVRSTIRDVVEKNSGAGSSDMKKITCSVIRDLLRDEHGIRVRAATILTMMVAVSK